MELTKQQELASSTLAVLNLHAQIQAGVLLEKLHACGERLSADNLTAAITAAESLIAIPRSNELLVAGRDIEHALKAAHSLREGRITSDTDVKGVDRLCKELIERAVKLLEEAKSHSSRSPRGTV